MYIVKKGSDRLKDYIVKAYLEIGVYYLTPELGLRKQFSEKVKWPADKCVKEDAQKYSYTYKIEEFLRKEINMTVKLKRRSNEIVKEIIIAPDFIEVYNLIREGYRVIEVSDEFHIYKEKWNLEREE